MAAGLELKSSTTIVAAVAVSFAAYAAASVFAPIAIALLIIAARPIKWQRRDRSEI